MTDTQPEKPTPIYRLKSRQVATRILITGGGTGGHVTPALATVQEIKRLVTDNPALKLEFLYLGNPEGLEKKLAEAAGIRFVGVATGKLRRATTKLGLLTPQNLLDLLKVPLGVVQSVWQVARFHPQAALSTGGYVCVPPVIACWLFRVPVVTHEQTVTVGLANKIAGMFARTIALSFEGSRADLPARLRHKTIVTGNPVRSLIFNGNPERAVDMADFNPADDHLPIIYVTGGAQGAHIINRAVEETLDELLQFCRVIHQCGSQPTSDEQDYDRLNTAAAKLPTQLRHRYYLTRFVGEEIGDIFAATSLVVSRSGAGTVTEVAALGKPAIFVPLVPTGGDEQTRNASRVEEAGAAVVIKQGELNAPRLLQEVRHLLENPELLEKMSRAALTLARPDAARQLAQQVLELATRP